MKCVGGEIGSASALAPKLGPLGLVCSHEIILPSYIRFILFNMIVTKEGR